MKMIKRKHLLFGIMLVLSGGAISADEIQNSINTAYRDVFGGKTNLFDEKNEDTYLWTTMLFDLKNYVNKNAGGNRKLEEAFKECQATSQQLIYALQTIYDDLFAAEKLDQDKIILAHNGIKSLLWARDNILMKEKNKLKDTRYALPKKKGVKKVLLHLIDKLDDLIDRVNNDFENKIALMKAGLF